MPERTLAGDGVLARAGAVARVAGQVATESEQRRLIGDDVLAALVDAGFARHFVPVDCGGRAATFAELTEAVVTIGRECAATAWCASLIANLARMAAFLPAEGYREVWADGPDQVVVGSLTPTGKAQPAAGGLRLTGQWPYISASDFSDWALLCGMAPVDGKPEPLVFAVPRAEYSVQDTWFNVGMRATGSNTVVVDDVFVPAARTFRRERLFAGLAVDSTAACHSVPLLAANGLSFATPVLGASQGALDSWSAYITQKVRTLKAGVGLGRGSYDQALARSSGEIDAAGMLLARASATADAGAGVTPADAARNLRDCALSVELLVAAVNRLFHTAGTTGQSAANPMQRHWRDVNAAATHVALQFEPAATTYAHEILGEVS